MEVLHAVFIYFVILFCNHAAIIIVLETIVATEIILNYLGYQNMISINTLMMINVAPSLIVVSLASESSSHVLLVFTSAFFQYSLLLIFLKC